MKKLIFGCLTIGLSLCFAAPAANADQFTFTSTFTDTGPSGNGLTFAAQSGFGGTTSISLPNLNSTQTIDDFLIIHSTDSNFGSSTDNLSVGFSFSQPGSGSGTVTGTGQETLTFFFATFHSGSIDWGSPAIVSFADGSKLQIALSDVDISTGLGSSYTAGIDATFTMIQAPSAVPGPTVGAGASSFVLAALLLGWLVRRRGHQMV